MNQVDWSLSHGVTWITGTILILIYYSHHRVALLLYNKVEGVGEEEFAGIRKRRENLEVTEIVCIFAVKNKGVDYEIDKGRSIETL